ncbi:MalY/PatB family protein [Cetobacterium sp.]|uniref:MalY/PatB family protein n=1 Tax=Cetobacterium sp. TaxID=2071632 RepID=UPI003EE5AC15
MYNFELEVNRKNTNSIKWNKELLNKWCGAGNDETLSYWVADMDFKSPPEIINGLKSILDEGVLGYSDFTESYYSSVITWYKKKFNVTLEKEWILYSNGIVPALNYIVQEFCQKGDNVIIQTPVYYPFSQAIENNGLKVLNNNLLLKNGKYEIDYQELEKLAKNEKTKLMFFCSPHNPGGRVWRKEEIKKILEICKKNGVLLVSDEIHGDIVFKENKHTPITEFEEYFDNIILCSSPSKTFNIAGLQTSNIIIPNKDIREKFKKVLYKNSILLPNIFGIKAVEIAYTECDLWLEELLQYLEGNLSYLKELLNTHLPKARLMEPEGTDLAWIDMSEVEKDYKKRAEIIREKSNVLIDNGFVFGECGENFERINFACSRSILEEGILRIAENFKK